jgi:hypothetical protein
LPLQVFFARYVKWFRRGEICFVGQRANNSLLFPGNPKAARSSQPDGWLAVRLLKIPCAVDYAALEIFFFKWPVSKSRRS